MGLKIVEATPGERKAAYANGIGACLERCERINPYPLHHRRRNDWFDGYDKANKEMKKLIDKIFDSLPDFRPRMY